MATSDPATITDVTLVTAEAQKSDDVFAITLSADGIEVRRPDQPSAHIAWSRVSEWKIEERASSLVLTLRGDGSTTPLAIRGWSVSDLDTLMHRFTEKPGTVVEAASAAAEPVTPRPAAAAEPVPGTRRQGRLHPKAVVAVALLGLFVLAVTIVLLQSAGIISWSFLGPTS
jgi:hypothetical protein